MKKRASFLLSMFAAAVVFAWPANGATHIVTMTSQNKFSPAVTNILVGDTIVWTNAGFVQHTVTPTNNPEAFCGTALLNSCQWTFTQPGAFAYYCIPHFRPPFQTMTGLVVVASPPNTPPTIAITNPQSGASFAAPASFQISASANDAEGPVTNVEFLVNGVSLGMAQPPTFSVSIQDLAVGNYTLTAIAKDNVGATNVAPPVSITVTQVIIVPKYLLTISVSPENTGTVAAEPTQPESGYESNAVVTLTAAATAGFAFQNWSGDATGAENPIAVTMNGYRNVTANFAPIIFPTRTLTLGTHPVNGGSIHVAPAPNGANGTYTNGTVITVTANPAFAFGFINWSGAVSASTNPLVLKMDADMTAIANFVPIIPPRYQLTVIVSPTHSGRVLVTPDPNFEGTYASNTTVALAAFPEHGFRFAQWIRSATSTNNPLLLALNANTVIIAEFEDAPSLDLATFAGRYNGLALNDARPDHAASGTLNIRLSKTGAYRGTAVLGGMKQIVAGQFDRFGYAPFVMRRGTLSGSLQLESDHSRITGVLTDGDKSPVLLLYRALALTNSTELAGTYALTFGTNGPVATEGSATMSISTRGLVRIRGTLADGARFSQRTRVNSDARVPLAAVLYGNSGSLLGWLDFTTNAFVEGAAQWTRPVDSRSRDFPVGFAIQVPVNGGRQ